MQDNHSYMTTHDRWCVNIELKKKINLIKIFFGEFSYLKHYLDV